MLFRSFVIAGFVQNWIICLIVGIALVFAVLFVLRSKFNGQYTEA